MPEIIRAKLYGTEKIIDIQDVQPLVSAVKFKSISDAIWDQKPTDLMLACHDVPSSLEAKEVRDALNEIVGEIDEAFVISGIGKALDLGQLYGQGSPVIVSAEVIDNPKGAYVETFNWDNRSTFRYVEIGGERKAAEFLDGHTDYYRELGLKLSPGSGVVATYSMQRMQASQDRTTSLNLNVWHVAFADMGYEGHSIANADLSEQQETKILDLIERMTYPEPY